MQASTADEQPTIQISPSQEDNILPITLEMTGHTNVSTILNLRMLLINQFNIAESSY